jgi:hypothetical protein
MTAKEKAEALVNKMFSCVDELHKYPMCIDTAKQTSLIAVNEILESFIVRLTPDQMNFWNEVREEIKNYKTPLNAN